MKGVIFTEFLEMVEEKYGARVAKHVVTSEKLGSGGRYSAVGNYDHEEIAELASRLSSAIGVPRSEVTRDFGRHLFQRFAALYPVFFVGADSAFEFLLGIESYIHAELGKLYADAQFPSFACTARAPGHLEMRYRSFRPMADLAEGLILGCAAHFGEHVELKREDLDAGDGHAACFTLVWAEPPPGKIRIGEPVSSTTSR
jgi:hypothetical protein